MDTRAVMPSEIPTIRWSGRGLDVVMCKAKLIKLRVVGKQGSPLELESSIRLPADILRELLN